jgi:hypothetical protein
MRSERIAVTARCDRQRQRLEVVCGAKIPARRGTARRGRSECTWTTHCGTTPRRRNCTSKVERLCTKLDCTT